MRAKPKGSAITCPRKGHGPRGRPPGLGWRTSAPSPTIVVTYRTYLESPTPFRVHGNPLVLLGIREEHTLDGEEKAHQSESRRRVQPISGIAAYTSPARAHDKMIELPTPLPVWQAVSGCHGACPLCDRHWTNVMSHRSRFPAALCSPYDMAIARTWGDSDMYRSLKTCPLALFSTTTTTPPGIRA